MKIRTHADASLREIALVMIQIQMGENKIHKGSGHDYMGKWIELRGPHVRK